MSIFKTATSKDENSLSGLRIATGSTLKKEAIEETNRALAEQAKHLAEDVEYMKQYTAGLIDGKSTTDNFNKTLGQASKSAQDQAEALRNGTMSAQVYEQQQNAAAASTKRLGTTSKAAAVGVKALSVAGNMLVGIGIGLAIDLFVKGLDYLVHANEKAIEKANELRSAYEQFTKTNSDNIKILGSLKVEFEELSKGVDKYGKNISLTADQYERYKEILQQILNISPSLAEGYTTENGLIADKNGLIERAIELQEIESRNELRKITNLENLKTSLFFTPKIYFKKPIDIIVL